MWKESYRIGIDCIDEQHIQLFQIVEGLLAAIDANTGREPFSKAIAFMKNYVVRHFADEEAYQMSIGYSALGEHRRAHRQFTQAVLAFDKRLEASDYDIRVVKDLAGMLTAWLIYHVADADQRIAGKCPARDEAGALSCIDSFSASTVDVFGKMAGIGSQDLQSLPGTGVNGDAFVEIGLLGDRPGSVRFGFPREVAFGLIEAMTFFRPEGIDELVCSALAELANIASGNAATALAARGLACDITPPIITTERRELPGSPESARIITPFGDMSLAVSLAK